MYFNILNGGVVGVNEGFCYFVLAKTLRLRPNGHICPVVNYKLIFVDENCYILIQILLKVDLKSQRSEKNEKKTKQNNWFG